jgi:ribonuclease BN (tRNA processing enzyme)
MVAAATSGISNTLTPAAAAAAAASSLQTSHITPQQAGGIFAAAKPRLAVAHHLTVNAASRAAIIQDIRQGYPQV